MRIQLIDDETTWLNFAISVLEAAGHTVTDDAPDLALVSVHRLRDAPACPFIVMSWQQSPREAIAAYEQGARDYQAKDMRADVLLGMLDD